MSAYQLIHSSAHDTGLPAESVDAVITSPPYFGLRAYAGEQCIDWPEVEYSPMPGLPPLTISAMRSALGMEPSIESYIGHLMLVMREMWRVLKPHGTAWINLGDSYANDTKWGGSTGGKHAKALHGTSFIGRGRIATGLQPKSLMGIPWRFAFAAQADGWLLRSDVIWAKGLSFLLDYAGSCMPESVQDRPTKGHEYIFLLAKRADYYFDMEAVREPARTGYNGSTFTNGKTAAAREHLAPVGRAERQNQDGANGRQIRSVWAISPQPYSAAHFAVWPPHLVEPMIKASTSAHGVCSRCGAPWEREVERDPANMLARHERGEPMRHGLNGATASRASAVGRFSGAITTTGWRPTCDCTTGEPVPATVLDCFSGSGTTGRVALKLGRNYIGCDVSEQYLTELAPERMSNVQMEMAI